MLIYSKLIKNSGMQVVFMTSKYFSVVWHLLPNLCEIILHKFGNKCHPYRPYRLKCRLLCASFSTSILFVFSGREKETRVPGKQSVYISSHNSVGHGLCIWANSWLQEKRIFLQRCQFRRRKSKLEISQCSQCSIVLKGIPATNEKTQSQPLDGRKLAKVTGK